MLLRKFTCLILCFFLLTQLRAQIRSLPAVKVTDPPSIDGKLDDNAWKDIPAATDFIQNFPSFGKPASQLTTVKVVYDNEAIYIGAMLYDDPLLIRKQYTARDEDQQKDADLFAVFLDTYNDDQNGFQFLVTSSNVQTDAKLGANFSTGEFGVYGDKTWDAVWNSKVAITDSGWIVEIKIPFYSLRFGKKDIQDWGIQFLRLVRRTNEITFWNPVDPNNNGFVNQFGALQRLENIKPPLRLSFSPYLSTGFRITPRHDGGSRAEWLRSGGMDVKYGLNESFTLDVTLIPDFGQVVSDNVVNNLTPYEVQLQENRPFFTEGTELFNKAGLFYSRRIGRVPGGFNTVRYLAEDDPDIEIVKNPASTQLYNAIKFSGRNKKKLGIGVFNAVTAPMYATWRSKTTGEATSLQTEPLTNYNIIVVDQAFSRRSFLTFTNTNVIRNGAARDANVSGLDFSWYDKRNMLNLRGYGHYSWIFTDAPYDGYNTMLRFAKVSGKVQFSLQNVIRSDRYNPTDMGYLSTANQVITMGELAYKQLTPTRNFLSYSYALRSDYSTLYKPNKFYNVSVTGEGSWIFKNFWDVTLTLGASPDQHDYYVLGNSFTSYARRPAWGYAELAGSTDSRKKLFVSYDMLLGSFFDVPDKDYHLAEVSARYRFGDKLSVELSYRHEAETDYIVSAGRDNTGAPVISFVDFKDVTGIFSGIYNFAPRINLTLRLRHYWSNVLYKRFANVDESGNPVPRTGTPVQDNYNIFNVDAFFTWDFRLGSRLIFGYKNWLGPYEEIDGSERPRYLHNFGQTFGLRHANELTARFIYFIDYHQLKGKRHR